MLGLCDWNDGLIGCMNRCARLRLERVAGSRPRGAPDCARALRASLNALAPRERPLGRALDCARMDIEASGSGMPAHEGSRCVVDAGTKVPAYLMTDAER